MLKVTLIVVSGKPEGKVIPLTAPVFRVGRDESCHLRPNSVEVSRRHTEITISETAVVVTDLGSRNGTLVNGTLLTAPHRLKSGELLKIGPLTFAVSIQETAASAVTASGSGASPRATSGRVEATPPGQIESWLVADNARPTPDRPSGVYDGDTLTIDAYSGGGGQVPGRSPMKPASNPAQPTSSAPPQVPVVEEPVAKRPFDDDSLEFEQLEEGNGDPDEETVDADAEGESEPGVGDELIDESNPFYIPKKAKAVEEVAKKDAYKDTSDAANDILRRMIDRRRASKS